MLQCAGDILSSELSGEKVAFKLPHLVSLHLQAFLPHFVC